MKKYMKNLKEESLILLHNFILVVFILFGYHLLMGDVVIGKIIGAITFSYGIKMSLDALNKGIKEFIDNFNFFKKDE